MKYDQLNEKIMSMQDEIIEGIRQVVAIDSIKGDPLPDAPFGKGPKMALEKTLAMAKDMGFEVGMVGNHVGYAEYGTGEEMVGVLGHLDVVPLGEGWIYPPFGGEIHDGKMYGRGVLDDKGPIIGALYALKAIRELGLSIDRRIRIMFGTDEESGSACVQYYIESGAELPTIGFTPDAEYPLIFCEKGTTNFTIGKQSPVNGEIKVISFEAGVAANVVTPKATLVVEGDIKVEDGEGISVTKQDNRTTVTAIGVGAHGSTPALGTNAAIKLFKAVEHNSFGGDFQHMMEFCLEFLAEETTGDRLGICYKDEETGETTVNLGVLSYSEEKMSLTLDIRYPKNGVPEDVLTNVTMAASSHALDVLYSHHTPMLYVPKDSELVEKLISVYQEVTGDKMAKPVAIGGGTYAKAFKNMVAFGPEFPGDVVTVHQPNECVEVEKLMKAIQLTGAAMLSLAQK